MSLLRKEYDRRTQGKELASFSFIGYTYIAVLLITLGYILISGKLGGFGAVDAFTVLLGIGMALAVFVTTVICIVSASYGSVTLIVAFANLGTVTLSSVYGLLFDGERNHASVFTWIGLALVLAIMILNFMTSEKGEKKEEKSAKEKWIYKILCFVIFFTNGIALVIYSVLTKYRPSVGSWHFILLYSIACVLLSALAVIFFLVRKKRKGETPPHGLKVDRVCLAVIAFYAVSFLLAELMAIVNTTQLPIIVQAPLSFAIPLIILTVSECLIYKMKVTKVMFLEMTLALLSSICFVL